MRIQQVTLQRAHIGLLLMLFAMSAVAQQTTPRRPAEAFRQPMRSRQEFVTALHSRDPESRRQAMVQLGLVVGMLDEALLDIVLAVADDPATTEDALAGAAAALCAKGPTYFTKLTAIGVSSDSAAAARSRKILKLASHADLPRGVRMTGSQAFYPLRSERDSMQVGEAWRKALSDSTGKPDLIKVFIREYSRPSLPARRIGPVTKEAVRVASSQEQDPKVFQLVLAEQMTLQPPVKMDWQAAASPSSKAKASAGSTYAAAAPWLEPISWIAVSAGAIVAVGYFGFQSRR